MNELLFIVKIVGDTRLGRYDFVEVVSDSYENAHKVAIKFDANFSYHECEIAYLGIADSNFKNGDIVCYSYLYSGPTA